MLKENSHSEIRPVYWENDALVLLDQRRLPTEEIYLNLDSSRSVADAIQEMVVRGAPAIGIAAAYGVVLAAREACEENAENWRELVREKLAYLERARPTAVNLLWAIRRMSVVMENVSNDPVSDLLREANAVLEEDIAANRQMGELGAALFDEPINALTHCNAGALATGGYGTALGVIRSAHRHDKLANVYACETRPWLQGARLTTWELTKDDVPVTLITDSVAAQLMREGNINWVIVGADRIAANGDVANKIGTYTHAVTARHHGLGFMVVAPTSTIDRDMEEGNGIVIEQRSERELVEYQGHRIAPQDVKVFNPVFDITPADLVDVIVTEKGVVHRPDRDKVAALFSG